ncbi:MAG: hypothetical protein ACI9MR_001759 [Myxococcota bacterium]|jgi:hypothetical protein
MLCCWGEYAVQTRESSNTSPNLTMLTKFTGGSVPPEAGTYAFGSGVVQAVTMTEGSNIKSGDGGSNSVVVQRPDGRLRLVYGPAGTDVVSGSVECDP